MGTYAYVLKWRAYNPETEKTRCAYGLRGY